MLHICFSTSISKSLGLTANLNTRNGRTDSRSSCILDCTYISTLSCFAQHDEGSKTDRTNKNRFLVQTKDETMTTMTNDRSGDNYNELKIMAEEVS